MAEIIYHIATTVDGYIADTNGNCPPDWFLYEGDHVADFLEEIKTYDLVLMGSNTYKYGLQFGLQLGEPSYKGIKHMIFSKTLQFEPTNEVELVKENTIGYIKKLKENSSKKIWLCGGGELAGTLLDYGLIDTIKLKVNPTVGRAGVYLFGKKGKWWKNKRAEIP